MLNKSFLSFDLVAPGSDKTLLLDARTPARVLCGAMIARVSYRYYPYYGPLSARRDGWAMGCRETD